MAVYTVGQIAAYIRDSLDRDETLREVWISGEVSNLSRSASGHQYFTLKDANSQIRCVMFRGGRNGQLLANGGAVIAHGHVSFYEARGDLQFYVDMVQPEGLGELALELERLKARLEAEGLFDPSRKRPLPAFPKRIGVVTSPTGAVFHDICNIIGRRYPLAEVVLAPTPVQGNGAAAEIAAALRDLNDLGDIDVVIVARGGGSLEELWAFNEEAVARAIYASHIPVVSGVGHETDFTIADLVADRRAPTPSAAAELVVPDMLGLSAQVRAWQGGCTTALVSLMSRNHQGVDYLLARLDRQAPDVAGYRQSIDELCQEARTHLTRYLALLEERARNLETHLVALDPSAVLARGFAVVQRVDTGETVRSTGQVSPGIKLEVTVSDGAFGAHVA